MINRTAHWYYHKAYLAPYTSSRVNFNNRGVYIVWLIRQAHNRNWFEVKGVDLLCHYGKPPGYYVCKPYWTKTVVSQWQCLLSPQRCSDWLISAQIYKNKWIQIEFVINWWTHFRYLSREQYLFPFFKGSCICGCSCSARKLRYYCLRRKMWGGGVSSS